MPARLRVQVLVESVVAFLGIQQRDRIIDQLLGMIGDIVKVADDS